MTDHVVALFRDTESASQAVDQLVVAGIPETQISILMGEGFQGEHFGIEDSSKAPEGAVTGGLIGGALGTIAASLATASTVAIPVAGLVISGPIIAALAGAGVGGVTGGLIGGLVGLGIPEHQAKIYEDAINNNGGMLLGVEVDDSNEDQIKNILKDAGGEGVYDT